MKTLASSLPVWIASLFPPKPAQWWSRCRGVLLAFLFLAGSPAVFADAMSDVADAINEVQAAENAAKQDIPTTGTSKAAEDALDAAARNTDDAAQNNAAVKANPNSTDAQKETAQSAEDAAWAAENTARATADAAKGTSRTPETSDRYREALRQRRVARMKLKKAMAELRPLLGGFSRREVEPVLQRAARVLGGAERPVTVAMLTRPQDGTALAALTAANRLKMVLAGTGETIGKIATLTLTNPGDVPVTVKIPPLLLISRSGKSQHYAAPFPQSVSIAPGKSKVVPLEGVCISRSKPPVAKGESGELIAQDAEGRQATGPKGQGQAEGPAIPAAQTAQVLKAAAAYYQAAEKLQKEGAYKRMPYSQPKMQKEIAVQWGIWCDSAVAKISGEKPAAKEDLAKTIYKQAEEKGPVAPETKQKLDQGIDEIFGSIQLTGKAAKAIQKSPAALKTDGASNGRAWSRQALALL